MGRMKHSTIIVTDWDKHRIDIAHSVAHGIFDQLGKAYGKLISSIHSGVINMQ